MHKKSSTRLLAGALATLLLPALPAAAQRDAGAKLRGETGRYSGRPAQAAPRRQTPQVTTPARSGSAIELGAQTVQPRPAADPEVAYSLQPLPFSVGDEVTTVGEPARLMRGRRTLGRIPAGRQLRVLRIRGPWVGVAAELEGQSRGGWVWYSQLTPAGSER